MPTADERLEKLNMATTLCVFEKGQQSSAKSSLWWGVICIGIGLVLLRVGSELGAAIDFGFGALLVGTGLYQQKVRSPRAVQVSAAMLPPLTWRAIELSSYGLDGLIKNRHPHRGRRSRAERLCAPRRGCRFFVTPILSRCAPQDGAPRTVP
jgi:hypothetical protein